MDRNDEIQTFFNGIELPLDDWEQFLSIQNLSQSMTRYQVLNFSLCAPSLFNVMINTDGYDFIAYQPTKGYDYHLAPIIMTVSHQDLEPLQLGSDFNQFSFLELILRKLQSPLNLFQLEETCIDGYGAVKVKQVIQSSNKCQTTCLWIMNQALFQISISFNEQLGFTEALTTYFIQSFKVNKRFEKTSNRTEAYFSEIPKWLDEIKNQENKFEANKEDKAKTLVESKLNRESVHPIIQLIWDGKNESIHEVESFSELEVEASAQQMKEYLGSVTINNAITAPKTFSLNEWLKFVDQLSSQSMIEQKPQGKKS